MVTMDSRWLRTLRRKKLLILSHLRMTNRRLQLRSVRA